MERDGFTHDFPGIASNNAFAVGGVNPDGKTWSQLLHFPDDPAE